MNNTTPEPPQFDPDKAVSVPLGDHEAMRAERDAAWVQRDAAIRGRDEAIRQVEELRRTQIALRCAQEKFRESVRDAFKALVEAHDLDRGTANDVLADLGLDPITRHFSGTVTVEFTVEFDYEGDDDGEPDVADNLEFDANLAYSTDTYPNFHVSDTNVHSTNIEEADA